jgi:hypothetical protein
MIIGDDETNDNFRVDRGECGSAVRCDDTHMRRGQMAVEHA